MFASHSGSECVFTELAESSSLLGTGSLAGSLVSGEMSTVGTGLLSSQISGDLGVLANVLSGSGDPLLGEHGQTLSNRLSNLLDLGKLNLRLGGNLADSKGGKLLALFGKFLKDLLLVFLSKIVSLHSLHIAYLIINNKVANKLDLTLSFLLSTL